MPRPDTGFPRATSGAAAPSGGRPPGAPPVRDGAAAGMDAPRGADVSHPVGGPRRAAPPAVDRARWPGPARRSGLLAASSTSRPLGSLPVVLLLWAVWGCGARDATPADAATQSAAGPVGQPGDGPADGPGEGAPAADRASRSGEHATRAAPHVGDPPAAVGAVAGTRPAAPTPAPPDAATPRMTNPAPPFRYPAALYARKVQGNVTLRLWVDSAGAVHPESTQVAEQSGWAALDSAAVAGAGRLRFAPARRGGRSVGTAILFPVYFRHPEAAPLPGDTVLGRARALP